MLSLYIWFWSIVISGANHVKIICKCTNCNQPEILLMGNVLIPKNLGSHGPPGSTAYVFYFLLFYFIQNQFKQV